MRLPTATHCASPEPQLPAVFIQSCLSFRKDYLACGEVATRGPDDLRVPVPQHGDHRHCSPALLYIRDCLVFILLSYAMGSPSALVRPVDLSTQQGFLNNKENAIAYASAWTWKT